MGKGNVSIFRWVLWGFVVWGRTVRASSLLCGCLLAQESMISDPIVDGCSAVESWLQSISDFSYWMSPHLQTDCETMIENSLFTTISRRFIMKRKSAMNSNQCQQQNHALLLIFKSLCVLPLRWEDQTGDPPHHTVGSDRRSREERQMLRAAQCSEKRCKGLSVS